MDREAFEELDKRVTEVSKRLDSQVQAVKSLILAVNQNTRQDSQNQKTLELLEYRLNETESKTQDSKKEVLKEVDYKDQDNKFRLRQVKRANTLLIGVVVIFAIFYLRGEILAGDIVSAIIQLSTGGAWIALITLKNEE